MAYGTQQQVATMASTWTNNGAWDTTSNPTLSQVNDWLDLVSAQFDIALGTHWFQFPVSSAVSPTAHKAISQQVVSLVADLCNFKNSSGRFFTEKAIERGSIPMTTVLREINNWIKLNADGLVADKVPQIENTSNKSQVRFRVIG